LEFRLTYEGPLLGASKGNTRARHKHDIRLALEPQLKRLWQVSPFLSELQVHRFPSFEAAVSGNVLKNAAWANHPTYVEHLSRANEYHNRTWLPLMGEDMGLTCGLDILFLRPGSRGGLLNVGDIDGRLKTLFDALAIPKSGSHIPASGSDEPTYVLLGDDRLISRVTVETDELLEPTSPEAGQGDARLVITVRVQPLRANWLTLGFSAL
jgi:hypothetical protein